MYVIINTPFDNLFRFCWTIFRPIFSKCTL